MSTTFKQWNPTQFNQQDDAAYLSDALRVNGAPTAAILPSATANKLFYQVSTFVAAFAQMMSNKGYNLSDASFSTLVAVLTNVKTAAEFLNSIVVIPYATSVVFNAAVSAQFDLTLTGNVASSSLTNVTEGELLLFLISQDGTGGRSFVWPTSITSPGAICQIANSTSLQFFVRRPTSTGSAILPITPMMWVTPSGLRFADDATVVSVSANGTVSSAYKEIIEKVTATSGMVTRTLYVGAAGHLGRKVHIKKVDATGNTVRAAAGGGQTIDGQPNFDLSRQWDSITLVFDGISDWSLI